MLGPVLISIAWLTIYKKYYDLWRPVMPVRRAARSADYTPFLGPGPIFLHSATLHVTKPYEIFLAWGCTIFFLYIVMCLEQLPTGFKTLAGPVFSHYLTQILAMGDIFGQSGRLGSATEEPKAGNTLLGGSKPPRRWWELIVRLVEYSSTLGR